MAIYAISDLHLSFGTNKPMDVFGYHWENHTLRLSENWRSRITEEDWVLVPGDISWGINMDEADPDLAFIEQLPGRKILSKGNHDYWWSTLNKFSEHFRQRNYHTLHILHNNAYSLGNITVCGSRGWKSKDEDDFCKEDQKIYSRELERLKLSLREGQKLGGELVAMLHYPPFDLRHRPNDFGNMLKEFGVKTCIYGHIHGKANESWKDEIIDSVRYHLVSCNLIDFNPLKL